MPAPKRSASPPPRARAAPATLARAAGVQPTALGLIAAAAALLLYVGTTQFGWVLEDSRIVASRGASGPAGFHPFIPLLYRAEWLVGIGSPPLFHFVNVLLHALATWLVFVQIRGVGASPGVAFGAALLFAAHPVHVEAVAYVSARPYLVATAASLGALALARGAPVCGPGGCRSWRVWPAYALLAVAVLSDEVALVTPLILVALDRWGEPRVPARGRIPLYAGFGAVALAGILTRIGAGQLDFSIRHDGVAPDASAAGAALLSAGHSLSALHLPFAIDMSRSVDAREASDAGRLIVAAGLFLIIALYVAFRRADPLARTGAAFLLLPLIPTLPIAPFEGRFAEDRAAYFASVGVCFLAASAFTWLRSRLPRQQTLLSFLMIALAAAAAIGTLKRLPVWSDDTTLLAEIARSEATDPRALLALSEVQFGRGDLNAALASLDEALRRDPRSGDAHKKRAVVLSQLGRYAEAEEAGHQAVTSDPGDAIAWSNLADILHRAGKPRESAAAARRAVALDSTNAENWYNLGVSLAAGDSLPGAIEAYRRAVALNPEHAQAVNNLGVVLGASGRLEEAKVAYEQAVRLSPASVQSRMNLALVYFRLGDRASAARERDAVKRLNPAAATQLNQLFQQAGTEAAP